MAFKRLRGVLGVVFEPGCDKAGKKHRCPDCRVCQWCGDARCRECLRRRRRCGPPPDKGDA